MCSPSTEPVKPPAPARALCPFCRKAVRLGGTGIPNTPWMEMHLAFSQEHGRVKRCPGTYLAGKPIEPAN